MRMIHAWPCVAIAAIAFACGDSERPATPDPTPPAAAPAEPAPPEPAAAAPAPVAVASEGDPARGAEQYKLFCATCHGEDGCSVGPGAAGLDPQPAKHCDGHYMNALSDEHLFKVIQQGGAAVGKSPLMTPWGGTLTDAQIWDVVAYLRSIADPPYRKN